LRTEEEKHLSEGQLLLPLLCITTAPMLLHLYIVLLLLAMHAVYHAAEVLPVVATVAAGLQF
jgi:hypothetical protein